jgi:hypothetical protein
MSSRSSLFALAVLDGLEVALGDVLPDAVGGELAVLVADGVADASTPFAVSFRAFCTRARTAGQFGS